MPSILLCPGGSLAISRDFTPFVIVWQALVGSPGRPTPFSTKSAELQPSRGQRVMVDRWRSR